MTNELRIAPIMSVAAKRLVMEQLALRNLAALRIRDRSEGHDIDCFDPRPGPPDVRPVKRLRVKNRYQIDCNRKVFVNKSSLNDFDFLVVVFLNVGYFYGRGPQEDDPLEPEFYVLPRDSVREHLEIVASRLNKSCPPLPEMGPWGRVVKIPSGLHRLSIPLAGMEQFKNEQGFELIARALDVEDS